jgi:hypothetical protein
MSGRVGSITTDIVRDGLVFNMDAANRASYIPDATTSFNTINLSQSGSLENGVDFIQPPISSSHWDFDGTDDYINVGNNLEINTNAAWSISFWANLTAYSPVYPVPFTIKTDESTGFICFFSAYTSYEGINFGSNANFTRFKTTGDISASLIGTWNNVTLTYNGNGKTTDSNYIIYVNGAVVANVSSNAFGAVQNSTLIGREEASNTFNGGIANFLVYNRALSASEVLRNYNGLKGRFGL